ncbi:hypothetical protein HW555_010255 [Spodoptera exigua]|uniref:Uncharacterized protein n=1 Tax=Spodoptera exigua TaxID=7107 RepID=A0A835GAA3_SPOEX|nr:hypothetical protein HW555_010255 [Spodoptera exigua]
MPYSILLKKENAHDDPIYCCTWAKINTSGDSELVSHAANLLYIDRFFQGKAIFIILSGIRKRPSIAATPNDLGLIYWDALHCQRIASCDKEEC